MHQYSSSYGPLQPLHEHIISTAQPVTILTAHHFAYPIAPLFIQAYLLQFPNTRKYRIPFGIISAYFVWLAWKGYRFYEPWLNIGNILIGVCMIHLLSKAVEFALLEDPVEDPFLARGRDRLMCAFDLLCNSRWIGLRPVPTSTQTIPAQPKKAKAQEDSADRWLTRPSHTRTRKEAFRRHLTLALSYFLFLEISLHLLRQLGSTTLGTFKVPPGGFDQFFDQPFFLLPRTRFAFRAPRLLVNFVVKACIGNGVVMLLNGGYHMAGAAAVGSGVYEVEAWEPDMFANPLGVGSLLEFWGKGWHQIFRHHFGIMSTLIISTFHLTKLFHLPIAFGLSGALHALGQISMSPSPAPLPVFLFFLVQSVGCLAEIIFKRLTGKKVGGWIGWAWKIAFLATSAEIPLRTEMESGLGGSWFLPDIGVGSGIAKLIVRYIVDHHTT